MCWFVGEVMMFFSHKQHGITRFFAAVNVMEHHHLGRHGIPEVKKNADVKHFAVINVDDIMRGVALIRYSDDETKFKVSWRYARYNERMCGKTAGHFRNL
ncbi:hypothetical protein G6F56_010812 [Rhizopus delemar]|nr:hypothetical protein G6F56_010812 [Rhizopus delemar]